MSPAEAHAVMLTVLDAIQDSIDNADDAYRFGRYLNAVRDHCTITYDQDGQPRLVLADAGVARVRNARREEETR
jgi:hypothetical protein